MNYYPHHIGDFNNATRHLTRVERVLYREAIELYYVTENELTSDFNKLARRLLAVTDDEKDALKTILSEFFTLTNTGYYHNRCEHEIAKYRANTSNKAKAGIASALAKKNKSTRVEQMLNTSASDEQRTNNQEPITNNQEPVGGAGKVIELKIANPPPPTEFTYSSQKFSMYGEWTPSDSFETLAKIAGMKLGDDYPVDEFLEFRTYWVTQPAMQRTQGEWEHAFIKSYKTKQLKGVKK
jgi:uncharacterized protein YdaU (DUF1376 family)